MKEIKELMKKGLGDVFPSAVLFIAKKNKTVFHEAYGFIEIDGNRRPVQKKSLFDLASLTKIFTTTAFLTLVDAKKISLDTPIQKIFGEFTGKRPVAASIDPQTKRLRPPTAEFANRLIDTRIPTFRHILTHTSGLPASTDFFEKRTDPFLLPKTYQKQLLSDFIQQLNFAYPPETKTVYSDIGYILLGEAIARLSGVTFWEYLQSAVLRPLHLQRLSYSPGKPAVPTENCLWRKRLCFGEVHDEKAASLGGLAGHAGIFATAAEAAKLGQLYLNKGKLGNLRVLSAKTAQEAVSPQKSSGGIRRGFGWILPDAQGNSPVGRAPSSDYGHTGFTGTLLWVSPKRNLVIALLTNSVYYGRDKTKINAFRANLYRTIIKRWE